MDPITTGISVSVFALFTFFSILISSFVSKDTLKENKRIIISSFFLLITIIAITFDLSVFRDDVSTVLWQFLIAFSFTMSTFLLVNEIKLLYIRETSLNILHILLIATALGGFMAIVMWLELYFISSIIYGLLILLPYLYLMFFINEHTKKIFKSVFFYQLSLIIIFFSIRIIEAGSGSEPVDYSEITSTYAALTMIPFIVLITVYISYLLEKERLQRLQIKNTQVELEKYIEKVKEASETDMLTEIANRYKIADKLDNYLKDYLKNSEIFSIMMIDVNLFKYINDNYGHVIGDEVLKFVPEVIQPLLDKDDLIGRWGGDEFIIILPDRDDTYAQNLKDRIDDVFKKTKFAVIDDYISLAIGFVSVVHDLGISELINIADERMYEDKKIKKTHH